MKGILTECGFIDHKGDATNLKKDSVLDSFAKGHAEGAASFLGLKRKVVEKVDKNKPDEWAEDLWEVATKNDIVDGTRPKDTLTRQEFAATVRMLEKAGVKLV
jgi:N-acetylmuramoyl-L-alanine amidase